MPELRPPSVAAQQLERVVGVVDEVEAAEAEDEGGVRSAGRHGPGDLLTGSAIGGV